MTTQSEEFMNHSTQNGAPPDEVRVAKTPGFVASSHRDEDSRACEQRKLKLTQRVQHYEVVCKDLRTQLDAAEARRDGLPDHALGWPFLLYLVLAALTIGIEYVPAKMFTEIFYQTGWVQIALTLTFTAIGAVVAIFFGELLRRLRVPERSHIVDQVFLIVVGVLAVAYLCIGYFLRVSYTTAGAGLKTAAAQRLSAATGTPSGAIFGLSPMTEAIALTAVAAIGIILTVVSTYHRESLESFGVNSRIRRLRRELVTNEGYKNTNNTDLDRVEKSGRAGAAPAAGGDGTPKQQTQTVTR